MKVAIFGGSFNPIHKGHLGIANELIKTKLVDEVWIIPCGNHAFGKELASGEDRMKMINLALENNSSIKAIGMELNSNKTSYTSETIKLLKKEFTYDFYFVLGSDNLKDLKKWHDFEYLKNNVNFILIKREGFEFSNKLGINISNILEFNNTLSSSKIRENLRNGLSIKNLVPEKVERYLGDGRLYHE